MRETQDTAGAGSPSVDSHAAVTPRWGERAVYALLAVLFVCEHIAVIQSALPSAQEGYVLLSVELPLLTQYLFNAQPVLLVLILAVDVAVWFVCDAMATRIWRGFWLVPAFVYLAITHALVWVLAQPLLLVAEVVGR